MLTKILTYLALTIGGAGFYTIGDIFIKKWSLGGTVWQYWTGILVWILGLIILSHSFKFENMAVVSSYIVLANVLCLVFVSTFLFNEPLTKIQLVGVFLGIASMICLYKG